MKVSIIPMEFNELPLENACLFSVNTNIHPRSALEEASTLLAGVIEYWRDTQELSNLEYTLLQSLKASKALIDAVDIRGACHG